MVTYYSVTNIVRHTILVISTGVFVDFCSVMYAAMQWAISRSAPVILTDSIAISREHANLFPHSIISSLTQSNCPCGLLFIGVDSISLSAFFFYISWPVYLKISNPLLLRYPSQLVHFSFPSIQCAEFRAGAILFGIGFKVSAIAFVCCHGNRLCWFFYCQSTAMAMCLLSHNFRTDRAPSVNWTFLFSPDFWGSDESKIKSGGEEYCNLLLLVV